MEETKSNWACVANMIKDKENKAIQLGRYASYWFHKTPRRMLHSMSYYKFASKLIGQSRRVLDVGCNEGLGTWLLAKECGYAEGIDFDVEAIDAARKNFSKENISFHCKDFIEFDGKQNWDAITSFDVIEHIYPNHVDSFFFKIKSSLSTMGMTIIGTPSEISQKFASEISKKGHVNIYSPSRLEEEMKKHFSYVFMFSANDEIVHTGYPQLAHYLITVGFKKR